MDNENVGTGASAPQTEQTTQASVDWSKITADAIPAEVIKQHPLYKSVLGESIERRQEIAELKKQVPTTPAQPPTATAEAKDPVREALDRVAKLEQAMEQERVQNWRVQAAREAGIPEKFATRLVGTTLEEMLADAKSIAEALPKSQATSQTVPPSSVPGNAAGNERDTTMLNRITARMGSTYGVMSAFDPGIQRQVGGGARD
jgi:hypothetical protein